MSLATDMDDDLENVFYNADNGEFAVVAVWVKQGGGGSEAIQGIFSSPYFANNIGGAGPDIQDREISFRCRSSVVKGMQENDVLNLDLYGGDYNVVMEQLNTPNPGESTIILSEAI